MTGISLQMASRWITRGSGADPDFQLFVDATAELQKLDISGFTRDERMAFWINMYNVLVVRLYCTVFPCN